MERMLRKKKDNSEYEIDRELTGKLAIESNAELQDRLEQLEEEIKKLKEKLGEKIDTIQVLIREKYEEKGEKLELFKENKNLKSDLAETQKIGESWRQECKQLREELSKLKEKYGDIDY